MSKDIFEEERQRLMAITSIGMEVKALVLDVDGQVMPVDDPHVERLFYTSVFQAWADNKIDGTAEEIFDTIQERLLSNRAWNFVSEFVAIIVGLTSMLRRTE